MRFRLSLLLVFVLAVLAHVQSLGYWFTTTDTLPLIATSRVHSIDDLVGLFANPLMHGSDFVEIALFYRPVASLTYALDYAVWGLSPVGYHITNLVLHGTVAVLVAVAVAELTERPLAGQLSAVLFALHPLTVEVVPTTARRQDVLMSVFFLGALVLFVRSRKLGSRSLLGASVVAYALALGSKEPAILLPALLFTWVGLQRRRDGPVVAVRAAVAAVIPFAAVTIGYLTLRLAVLGELGGYAKDNPLTLTEVALIPIKYVLWVTHPVNVVEEVVTSFSPGATLSVLGLAALVAVPLGVRRYERSISAGSVAFLAFVGGLIAIPVILAYPTIVESINPFDQHDVVRSYLVGLVFVGSCVAGALAAAVAGDARVGPGVGAPVVLFLVWLVLPLGLFLMSDNLTLRPFDLGYSIHNSYLFVVPAMAIPALLVAAAVRQAGWRTAGVHPDANMAMIAVIALFLLPVVATSPLFHAYDGWRSSGEVNERALKGIAAEVESAPDGSTVVVEGLPEGVEAQRDNYPRVQSISPMRKHTVDAWLRLRYPDREYEVVIEGHTTVDRASDPLSVRRVASQPETVRIRISPSSTATTEAGSAGRIGRTAGLGTLTGPGGAPKPTG